MKYKDGKDRHTAAIVLCAGKGERTGLGYNKMLFRISGRPVAEHSMKASPDAGADDIICVASPADEEVLREYADEIGARVCTGGDTRTDSVRRALDVLLPETEVVLIHDGARRS